MTKIFKGATPAARPLGHVWSIMKLILRFSISIIKDWSSPPSLQVSPRIKSLAGHRNSNGSTTLYIRSKYSGAEQLVADLRRRSDGRLDVRTPYAMELADRVLWLPVGRRWTRCVPATYPRYTNQHLTAFDGDNTAAQQPSNAICQDILISGLRDVA